MKKIVVALMLIAAIAFVAVGVGFKIGNWIWDNDALNLGPDVQLSESSLRIIALAERLGVEPTDEGTDVYDFIEMFERIADYVGVPEINLDPEPTVLSLAWPDTITFGDGPNITVEMLGDYEQPPYIIHIDNPDTVEALYIEGREISLEPKLNPLMTFIAGTVFGALLIFLIGGE